MRTWVLALAIAATIPACADTRFRIGRMTRNDVPFGKGQCDIRLQVDNEVEVAVHGENVVIRTLAGQDARNDGSECNLPLPDRDIRGFTFEVKDSRNEIHIIEPPNRRNDFTTIVRIRDTASGFGRYHFRISWDAAPGGNDVPRGTGEPPRPDVPSRREPDHFSWNNVINFRGRGTGESRLNEYSQQLRDVNVDIDRGAKIIVSFTGERNRQVVFTGTVIGQDGPRLKADMLTEDRRLRGTMTLSVDSRNTVNSITLEATDGRDRLHLTWDRK